jgi:2OG-Fe(II) oxygenase superfamily
MNGDGLSIIDRLLSEDEVERMLAWLNGLSFKSVHHDGWRSVWRLLEGVPLRGPTWTIGSEGLPADHPPALAPLTRKLIELRLRDRPAQRVSLTPWLYPAGTALGLHRDDRDFDGAFVYYLTREWDVHWGGLLGCVTEVNDRPLPARAILDPANERSSVAQSGYGRWIAPAWNRLVLIEPNTRHFISRVDAAAGDRVRITIAGFFHNATQRARIKRVPGKPLLAR